MMMWGEGQNDLLMNEALSDLDKHLWKHGPDLDKELQKEINKLVIIRQLWGKSRDANLPQEELDWLLKVVESNNCDITRDDSGIVYMKFKGDEQTLKHVKEIR